MKKNNREFKESREWQMLRQIEQMFHISEYNLKRHISKELFYMTLWVALMLVILLITLWGALR